MQTGPMQIGDRGVGSLPAYPSYLSAKPQAKKSPLAALGNAKETGEKKQENRGVPQGVSGGRNCCGKNGLINS